MCSGQMSSWFVVVAWFQNSQLLGETPPGSFGVSISKGPQKPGSNDKARRQVALEVTLDIMLETLPLKHPGHRQVLEGRFVR